MTDRAEQTLEQFQADRLRQSIVNRAEALRTLADRLDGIANGVDHVGKPGFPSYGSLAVGVVHELTWGVANANVDHVVQAAVDADQARAAGE